MFDGIIVATDKGHDDAVIGAKQRFEQLARADGPRADFQTMTGVFFGADAAEKLIQIIGDAHVELLLKGTRLEARGTSKNLNSRLTPHACFNTPSTSFSTRLVDW